MSAKKSAKKTTAPTVINFSEACVINATASQTQIHDALNEVLAQLRAQTFMIFGEGYEFFNNCCEEIQNDYLWAINRKVEEAQALVERLEVAS